MTIHEHKHSTLFVLFYLPFSCSSAPSSWANQVPSILTPMSFIISILFVPPSFHLSPSCFPVLVQYCTPFSYSKPAGNCSESPQYSSNCFFVTLSFLSLVISPSADLPFYPQLSPAFVRDGRKCSQCGFQLLVDSSKSSWSTLPKRCDL